MASKKRSYQFKLNSEDFEVHTSSSSVQALSTINSRGRCAFILRFSFSTESGCAGGYLPSRFPHKSSRSWYQAMRLRSNTTFSSCWSVLFVRSFFDFSMASSLRLVNSRFISSSAFICRENERRIFISQNTPGSWNFPSNCDSEDSQLPWSTHPLHKICRAASSHNVGLMNDSALWRVCIARLTK